jgi:hypothetical protein
LFTPQKIPNTDGTAESQPNTAHSTDKACHQSEIPMNWWSESSLFKRMNCDLLEESDYKEKMPSNKKFVFWFRPWFSHRNPLGENSAYSELFIRYWTKMLNGFIFLDPHKDDHMTDIISKFCIAL